MPHPLFKTEIDAARALLQAGWRPPDINGVLQFPLSEDAFRNLGAKSLFFLVSDPSLAADLRPGAKQEAAAVLAAQGWTEIEIDALLKPERKFAPSGRFAPYEMSADSGAERFDSADSDPWAAPDWGPSNKSLDLLPLEARPLQQYRRMMGLNRILGLGLVIVSVGIVACILP